jgi:competence protein ComEC
VLVALWVSAGALAAGSAAGLRGPPPFAVIALGVGGALALARRRSSVVLLCLAAVALALGWAGAAVRTQGRSPLESAGAAAARCVVRGVLLESAGGLGTTAMVQEARCEGRPPLLHPGTIVLDGAPGDAGSALRARGWLLGLSDDGFGRARRALGARAYLDVEEVRVLPPRGGALGLASAIRRGLESATGALDPRRAALLRGLSIGDTSALDARTIESFRRAGLSHLLAVSGSNVAIVVGAVAWALQALALRTRVVIAALCLCLFVLVVGPEPSVLRAAAMGAIGLAALASGRRAEPLHALALALIVVVALRPGLVVSLGLHLSVAATAGIVIWSGPLARRLGPLPRPAAMGLGATLAAQAAVAPLLVATFGEVSAAGPVANALALPAVPAATVAGIAAAVAGTLHPGLGRAVALLGEPFAGWILLVGTHLGRASWATVALPRWSGVALGAAVAAALPLALRRS